MHIVFYVVGGLLLLVGLFTDTSVSSMGSDVVNLGKLQGQMMLWQAGLAAVITGAILQPKGAVATTTVAEMSEGEREYQAERNRKTNKIVAVFLVVVVVVVCALAYLGHETSQQYDQVIDLNTVDPMLAE